MSMVPGSGWNQVSRAAAEREESGVEYDARHQRARGAAGGAIGVGKPFVKGDDADFGAKTDQQQNADEKPHALRRESASPW